MADHSFILSLIGSYYYTEELWQMTPSKNRANWLRKQD